MQFYSSLCVLKQSREDFLGGPAFKTSPSNAGVSGLIPGWEAKISHSSWPKKKKETEKQEQHCNKFNKDFKSGPH